MMGNDPVIYKFCFYVPLEDAEDVKDAVFAAGAGTLGRYDRCAWQIRGEGQFRPLEGSAPARGKHHREEKVSELKVEMICPDECLQASIAALKEAHPYETPAYEYWRVGGAV